MKCYRKNYFLSSYIQKSFNLKKKIILYFFIVQDTLSYGITVMNDAAQLNIRSPPAIL